jgi:geranylgeranyl diphosphate synthase type I
MARRIARYKSGKYTVERPLHLGAALVGRLGDLAEPLSAYGLPLGEAFQMRDDILGTFGDPALTGKPVGEDLREGKPTPLLAITTDRAGDAARELLRRVGAPDLGPDEVGAIQTLMIETGARDETERLIDEMASEAVAALDEAKITAEARSALAELAEFVVHRDF